MISKKSRKVVAALLIGATVCASGTFAYFNSKVDLSEIAKDNAGTTKTLNITNGKVKITANIGGTAIAQLDKVWTYDVARLSTSDDTAALYKPGLTVNAAGKIKQLTEADDIAKYVTKNQSPDILGVGGATTAPRSAKAAVGEAVTGAITLARPGDAFVLGTANASGADASTGLEIKNESTLTTKVNIVASEASDVANADAELTKLFAGGWELYAAIDKSASDGNYTLGAYTKITSVANLKALAPTELKKGESVKIRLRVELPLVTGNDKQDPTKTNNGADTEAPNAVDLMKLFDIKVTQENNPRYSVDGTKNTIDDSDIKNDNGTQKYPTGW